MHGIVYLIPSEIASGTHAKIITPQLLEVLPQVQNFLVENVRSARRFLSSLKVFPSIEDLHFDVLDKDTKPDALGTLLQPLKDGKNIGIISEAGCPGIADPGALAVLYAHKNGIKVVPLVGPSSILMALMASGLNGQQFAFNGYLPIDKSHAVVAVREFEKESRKKKSNSNFH
jgi:16S rRNA (cytidine1402-2'-O)-methyltransferase